MRIPAQMDRLKSVFPTALRAARFSAGHMGAFRNVIDALYAITFIIAEGDSELYKAIRVSLTIIPTDRTVRISKFRTPPPHRRPPAPRSISFRVFRVTERPIEPRHASLRCEAHGDTPVSIKKVPKIALIKNSENQPCLPSDKSGELYGSEIIIISLPNELSKLERLGLKYNGELISIILFLNLRRVDHKTLV